MSNVSLMPSDGTASATAGGSWELFKGDFTAVDPDTGCYEYVVHLAKQVQKRFSGLQISSGYRENSMTAGGTLSDHSKRQAIDLTGWGSSNAGYMKIAEALVGHPYLNYCIADNQWNPKGDKNFTTYKYGGHNNHCHISLKSPTECGAITGVSVEAGTSSGDSTGSTGDSTGSIITKVFNNGTKFLLLLGAFILMVLFFMRAFPQVGDGMKSAVKTASNVVPQGRALNMATAAIKK